MSVVGPATAVDPIDALGAIGVIPVVVIDDAAQAAPLAEALMSGGINGVEVTLRTPAARSALAVMAAYDGLLVGAGTLLEPQQAAQAADAGARFAVSLGFDPSCSTPARRSPCRFFPVLPPRPRSSGYCGQACGPASSFPPSPAVAWAR